MVGLGERLRCSCALLCLFPPRLPQQSAGAAHGAAFRRKRSFRGTEVVGEPISWGLDAVYACEVTAPLVMARLVSVTVPPQWWPAPLPCHAAPITHGNKARPTPLRDMYSI